MITFFSAQPQRGGTCTSCRALFGKYLQIWNCYFSTKCGHFRIFLSLRFYVKSILDNLEVLKLPVFFAIFGSLNIENLVHFSLQKVYLKILKKIKIQSLSNRKIMKFPHCVLDSISHLFGVGLPKWVLLWYFMVIFFNHKQQNCCGSRNQIFYFFRWKYTIQVKL